MKHRAEVDQLKTALRGFLDSVNGSQSRDQWEPASPISAAPGGRDTPGSQAAARASGDMHVASDMNSATASPLPGQPGKVGRRQHLPQEVSQAASQAERLLVSLELLDHKQPADTPGRRAAEQAGGTQSQLGAQIRQSMGMNA